jgi:parallel beta-helix repeat protein
MRKKNKPKIWIVMVVFMALMVTSVFAVLAIDVVSATTWYVEEGESIQSAVNEASSGDTIIVRDGTYTENVKVNVDNLAIQSDNGSENCIVQAANSNDHVFEVTADYVNISGFTVKGATDLPYAGIYLCYADYGNTSNNNSNNWDGIWLYYSNNNSILNNDCSSNNNKGIKFWYSNNNSISNSNCSNNWDGIWLYDSDKNSILNNNCSSNDNYGIGLGVYSNKNSVSNNNCSNNDYGIHLESLNNNSISNNNCINNDYGIHLMHSGNNNIYLNNFINNSQNAYSYSSTNTFNSTTLITYTYNGNIYISYLGNYWDDYTDIDADNDGIWDNPYSFWGNKDYYPLVEPWVNYFNPPEESIFDTGSPANPYPSILGNHTGTINPNNTVIATKLYTYPCKGTGGHTEYAEIRNATWNATATWEGYAGDWHNITFDKTVVLLANETYNYTIRTGSYPQIHHTPELPTANGWINCTGFIDANGKVYYDWIPAIRLWA